MGRWQDKRPFNTMALRKWHLQEASSHSCAGQQWALRDPSLNATYKLVTSLSKVPMHMELKVPNSSQLNGDNHSWFHLASSFRPQPPPKHSLSPAIAQSYNNLKRFFHQEKSQSKDSKQWYDAALPGNFFRVPIAADIIQYTQRPKKRHSMLYLTHPWITEPTTARTPWTMLKKVSASFSLPDASTRSQWVSKIVCSNKQKPAAFWRK